MQKATDLGRMVMLFGLFSRAPTGHLLSVRTVRAAQAYGTWTSIMATRAPTLPPAIAIMCGVSEAEIELLRDLVNGQIRASSDL
jgi:hypothetical protein